MRIAVSTMDGKTICGHLGKCRSFIIFEAEGGVIKDRRIESVGGMCPGHADAGSKERAHNVSPLTGCSAVITQGMGQGLLNGLVQAGIQPVITQHTDPETAVMLLLSGGISGAHTSNCSCGEHQQ